MSVKQQNFLKALHSWRSLSTTPVHFAQKQHKHAFDAESSESSGEEGQEASKKLRTSDKLAKYLPSTLLNILRGNQGNVPPSTLSIVDKVGGPIQLEVDIPVSELIEDAPAILKKELKKLSREVQHHCDPSYFERPELYWDLVGAEHGEAFIQYKFKTDKDMEKWKTGADSDWSEGYSKCDFYRTDRGTAIFEGALSKQLVKDGRTERAGWCSMKSRDKGAFGRKTHYRDWQPFSHLLIKCRGDGRSYKVMLHSPEYWDVSWGFSHSYPLHTHGGPYWQFEKIPFSRFFHTINGRIMDKQHRIHLFRTSSVGIGIMDRIDGPFRLELAFVGVCNDRTHFEQFAYETYNTQLANPDF